MSWHLTVTNKYYGSDQIPNIIVDGLGSINFTDAADK